jgi:hypothetical protein
MTDNIQIEIQEILDTNKISDLKRFIKKRQSLNSYNICLSYMFYLLQSIGILTTTIGTGYEIKELIWSGIGVNILASLIHSYEQINNNISIKLLKNIENIKKNTYVDEDVMIDLNADDNKDKNETYFRISLGSAKKMDLAYSEAAKLKRDKKIDIWVFKKD